MDVSQIFGQDESFSTLTLVGVADTEQSVTGGRTHLEGQEGRDTRVTEESIRGGRTERKKEAIREEMWGKRDERSISHQEEPTASSISRERMRNFFSKYSD